MLLIDVELDEVINLIDTTRRVVNRSLESILVMFYGNDMGNVEPPPPPMVSAPPPGHAQVQICRFAESL